MNTIGEQASVEAAQHAVRHLYAASLYGTGLVLARSNGRALNSTIEGWDVPEELMTGREPIIYLVPYIESSMRTPMIYSLFQVTFLKYKTFNIRSIIIQL